MLPTAILTFTIMGTSNSDLTICQVFGIDRATVDECLASASINYNTPAVDAVHCSFVTDVFLLMLLSSAWQEEREEGFLRTVWK